MTPQRLLDTAIRPALAELERQGVPESFEARRLLLAIALQESALAHRRQVTASGHEDGPAMSWVQFEKNGGCRGVLTHRATASMMRQACDDFSIEPTAQGLWEAMQYHDIIAMIAARLLVYTLPHKLPTTVDDGWDQYLSAWRPGRPKPDKWAGYWNLASLAAE